MTTRSDKITFTSETGHELAGRLDRPRARPRAFALFAHCFTCSKDVFAAARISQALAAYGIACLRFDFTGLGHSEGEFANTTFSGNLDDLVAAADWLRAEHQAPALLIGHSLGGAAVLAAAHRVPEAQAVVTIGAPADPEHVTHLFADTLEVITAEGEAEVSIGGRPFTLRKAFLDDIAQHCTNERIGALKKALLVMHAPFDQTVGISNATDIFVAAKHPKSFISLDGADHLLSRRADAEYAAQTIAAWASRYLPQAPEAFAPPAKTQPGQVTVAESGDGRYAQHIRMGEHLLRADEPASVGGDDTGPGPYDLLLAALGACTTMTLRMYAERKGLPLERAAVTLVHEKIHARDCAECESKDGKIDRIERAISLDGPLDDATRARLLEIADKCPVHRTLHSETVVKTRLVADK